MKRENVIWLILFVVGGALLIGRASMTDSGMGKAYVQAQEIDVVYVTDPKVEDGSVMKWMPVDEAEKATLPIPAQGSGDRISWTNYNNSNHKSYAEAIAKNANQTEYQLSMSRTIGIWIAAFFTIFVLSFLFGDNPFYKLSEAIFIGISAAYWMVIGFWATIVPNLIGKLSPDLIRGWSLPGLGAEEHVEWMYLIPLLLGIMLLWRLAPVGGWISRWPMAFIIGVFCGLRLITFLHANFTTQIRNSIEPLWALDKAGNFDFWASFSTVILLIGVLSSLTYFFFSFEHKGVVGKTAKLGIWFLMITFGAAFGYTVMGRIALLAIRIEFLFDDWLWLIDPTGKRVAMLLLGMA